MNTTKQLTETKYKLWKYNKDIQGTDEITNWKKYVRPLDIFTKYLLTQPILIDDRRL